MSTIDKPNSVEACLNYVKQSNGSCLFKEGPSTVVVSLQGPSEVKVSKQLVGKVYLEIFVKDGCEDVNAIEREMFLKIADYMLDGTSYPRCGLLITVAKVTPASLSACINAISMVLLDSGLSCTACVAAVTLGVKGESVLLFPSEEELSDVDCVVTLTFDSVDLSLVSTYTKGSLLTETYLKCLDVGKEAAEDIFAYYRSCLRNYVIKE